MPDYVSDYDHRGYRFADAATPSWQTLIADHTPVTYTNTSGALEQIVMKSAVIPGSIMGANGILVMTGLLNCTSSATVKTLRCKYAGATIASLALASQSSARFRAEFENFNDFAFSTTTPSGLSGYGLSTSAVATRTLDTSVEQNYNITGELQTAGDFITILGYRIEFMRVD